MNFQRLYNRFWIVIPLLLLSAAFLASTAFAQETGPTDDEVNAVAKGMYCPVCENIPLDVCPTQACIQWREVIREKLAEGWSEDEIKDYFVLQYGDRVLAEPPARGLNLVVYLVPPLMIIAGAYILFRVFRSWRKPVAVAETPAPPKEMADDEYIRRLEEEL